MTSWLPELSELEGLTEEERAAAFDRAEAAFWERHRAEMAALRRRARRGVAVAVFWPAAYLTLAGVACWLALAGHDGAAVVVAVVANVVGGVVAVPAGLTPGTEWCTSPFLTSFSKRHSDTRQAGRPSLPG